MTRTVLEICAGAGGQSLGLEAAGFEHVLAVDNDPAACATLRQNRPAWDVFEGDVREVSGVFYSGLDLLAGGVPCPPFSIAGKQLGAEDERDLFPQALRLAREAQPRAIMLENVKGLATSKFESYRKALFQELEAMGYVADYRVLHASNFGVPQLRPRFVLVAMKPEYALHFHWPDEGVQPPTVGEHLFDLMAAKGWRGARTWRDCANTIAPTIVGGSKKHGGPDLGPTRAREAWKRLRVNGLGLAEEAPGKEFPLDGLPKLTVRMVARLQGFPDSWQISGRKTAAHQQIGNAFPPPVALAVGQSIVNALYEVSEPQQPRLLDDHIEGYALAGSRA